MCGARPLPLAHALGNTLGPEDITPETKQPPCAGGKRAVSLQCRLHRECTPTVRISPLLERSTCRRKPKRKTPFPWWLRTRKGYARYLDSPEWWEFRERYKAKHPMVCASCDGPAAQLHHTTYRNVGRERLTDVVPLCVRCHRTAHDLIRAKQATLANAHLKVRRSLSGR